MNRGYIYVLLCYALLGIGYPVAKNAIESFPPWIFTCVTMLIGGIVLIPISLRFDKGALFSLSKKDWGIIAVQSVIGSVLYTVFLLYGMESSTAVMASIFTSLTPAFVLLLSAAVLKESLNVRKLIAIALAIGGVFLLTVPSSDATGHNTLFGLAMLLLSTLSSAVYVIVAKKYSVDIPAATIALGICMTGAVFTLPMALNELSSFDYGLITKTNVSLLVFYGITCWAAPTLLFFAGVTKIPASAAGMAFAATPLTASLFSILFLGEHLTIFSAAALALVIISILIAEAQGKTDRLEQPTA
ncbi:DMT family transporter [Pseudomonas gozinkensis]|uniref:DMT family transporter n=1 Tax=Pseudomonas gozinkensis TaxID=2774461 RepID=UPI001788458D|nr:DMT family transporter [Pseudomonas gozinkensis]